MAPTTQWILLAYQLPREPSAPRIALWRRLKRLGALQLGDGLVTLPMSSRNREQLEWLVDEIRDAGGRTTLWIAKPGTAAQGRDLAARMTEGVNRQYAEVLAKARAGASAPETERRRALARLRRTLRTIGSRDYFGSHEAEKARRAVEDLASAVEAAA
jgi:hypothetical protein